MSNEVSYIARVIIACIELMYFLDIIRRKIGHLLRLHGIRQWTRVAVIYACTINDSDVVNIANDLKYVLYLLIYVRSYLYLYLSFSLGSRTCIDSHVRSLIFLFCSRTRAPDELTGLIEALRTDLTIRLKNKFSNVTRNNFESPTNIIYA